MTDYSDVDAKLYEYSEAFDRYMEHGKMPTTVSQEDCLIVYMQEVIDNNPQIDGTDSTWTEILKDDLISYFSVLLEQFRALQLEAENELAMKTKFMSAHIETKRGMWQQVCKSIESQYSQYEVNLPGYRAQFKTEDKEAVFSALTNDWENACLTKLDRQEQQMLNRSKQNFEAYCRDNGTRDYEAKKKLDHYIHSYPQLKEIVDMIGREKDSAKEERDSVVYKFLPITVAKNSSIEEVDRIETGDNLERVIPIELSMPEDLFFKRYATKELQQFSRPGKDKPQKTEEHRKDPRLNKGPIIVCIDTSGSMEGRPEKIAFSLLRQLLRMAKKQKRACFLISFSVQSKSIDLAKPSNWNKINGFLENSFCGGTDGEQMLAEAIRVLQKGTYEMADVLIISDLEFPIPEPTTRIKIDKEKSLGTRFYALQIGECEHEYHKVLDKIWVI